MTSNYPNPEQDYTVLVRCFTFNQSKYIEDALNGFVMQQTTFPFVCLVVDDASTDGEQEVIKTWMERECDMADAKYVDIPTANVVIVPHKTNCNCTMAVYLLKENLYRQREKKMDHVTPWREHCRYEALCEGDDYWTEPLKLQKQVYFMNSHSEYSMCFHNAVLHWEDGREEDHSFSNVKDRNYSGVEIFEKWIVPTASVLLRKEVYSSAIYRKAVKNPYFRYGDIILFLSCAKCGKVRGMSNCMSVYRKQEGGVTYNVTTKYSIAHAFHSLNIYKEFGNEYKNLSVDFFMKTILNSYLMTRGDGNPQHKLLWSAFKVQPIITIKFVWKRFFRKDYIKKFFWGDKTFIN